MTLFTLYNLLVLPLVFVLGWESRRLWTQIGPYIIFWCSSASSDLEYGKMPAPKEKVIKNLGAEYGQQPLRKRFAKQKDKGLN